MVPYNNTLMSASNNITNESMPAQATNTVTTIYYYYIIMAALVALPAFAFLGIYLTNKNVKAKEKEITRCEPLPPKELPASLTLVLALLFLQSILYFGIQDAYGNLLATFAVLGPLDLTKTTGVYLTSLFWTSMCVGRLNGKNTGG